jgi:DNA-binding SARP family transcriptional activator
MLELRVFGTGRARYLEQRLPGFPNQLPYLLLCYLLLNRHQSQPREQLATLFWGGYPTSASLKHLRNTLWRMRHLVQSAGVDIDDYVVISDHAVSFSPSGRYWLDVEAFETATTRHQSVSGRGLSLDQALQLEEAVDLYAGDLLDGIYEDWCLYDRERLHLLHLQALGKLISYHEANGTYERGLTYGRRILASDSTRENVHRQMMRLYGLMGDRNAALAQYKRCGQILRDTLDVAPMEETTRLYEQIANGWFPAPSPRSSETAIDAVGLDDQHVGSLVQQALERLQHLQVALDEAGAELRRISHLINEVQARQQDAGRPSERRSSDDG